MVHEEHNQGQLLGTYQNIRLSVSLDIGIFGIVINTSLQRRMGQQANKSRILQNLLKTKLKPNKK